MWSGPGSQEKIRTLTVPWMLGTAAATVVLSETAAYDWSKF